MVAGLEDDYLVAVDEVDEAVFVLIRRDQLPADRDVAIAQANSRRSWSRLFVEQVVRGDGASVSRIRIGGDSRS